MNLLSFSTLQNKNSGLHPALIKLLRCYFGSNVPSKLCACTRAHRFQRLRTRINLRRTDYYEHAFLCCFAYLFIFYRHHLEIPEQTHPLFLIIIVKFTNHTIWRPLFWSSPWSSGSVAHNKIFAHHTTEN